MRTANYDTYLKERANRHAVRAQLGKRRSPSRRARDPKERELLLLLDKRRWERWLTTGKLKKLGKRHMEFF